MESQPEFEQAANGNQQALEFLSEFHAYVLDLGLFISDPQKESEALLKLAARTNLIYSLPYYAENVEMFRPVAMAMLASDRLDIRLMVRAVAALESSVGIDNQPSEG